jgi:hypothetical protein
MRLFVLTSVLVTGLVAACGANDSSTFGDGTNDGGTGAFDDSGGLNLDSGQADVDPYKNDPPPMWCGPDGGQAPPPPPGGTLDCPDDKNKEGCPCNAIGATAACWPGLRANRDLGICKDGTATCLHKSETSNEWGPCVGAVLPQPGGKGKAACKCFSAGQWKLSNLIPCFFTYNNTTTYGISTVLDSTGKAACEDPIPPEPPTAPPTKWSDDTLNVDCAGHFKLCYELKAGDYNNPQAADCAVTPRDASGKPALCVEGDYIKENVEQTFPTIGAWVSSDTACSAKFKDTGGYGEMTVIGLSVRCDKVDDGAGNPYVFHRVQYCPFACGANPTGPGCANCQQGGSGQF